MPRPSLSSALLVASLLSAASRAAAQGVSPSCNVIETAVEKQIVSPFHLSFTMTGRAGKQGTLEGESISTGGVTYLKYDGKWSRSGLTPQKSLKLHKSSVAALKSRTCKQLPDERVGAVAASVYSVHTVSDAATTDSKVWLAKSDGTVLRTDDSVGTEAGSTPMHIATSYDYANVKAPALTN